MTRGGTQATQPTATSQPGPQDLALRKAIATPEQEGVVATTPTKKQAQQG